MSAGQGSLLITSDVPVAAAARIDARNAQGDFGAFAAALDGSSFVEGDSATLIGLAQTSTIRSNLLLYNRGIAGEITVRGFKADGSAVGPVTVELGDHQAGASGFGVRADGRHEPGRRTHRASTFPRE